LFSAAVDQAFRAESFGFSEVGAGFASENESSLKPWSAPGKVRVPIRPAPPLTSGNASYCGFRPYLGCTPGTPGRPSDTSAARSASGPATPTTRSVRA